MTGEQFIDLMTKNCRRTYLIGSLENGLIAGLDLEGRLFAVHDNQVLNRVVVSAVEGRCNMTAFLNPGGDTLWPAPEGTCFGYEYGTGSWRVPPAITGAVWEIAEQDAGACTMRAEIDLINNRGLGLPCLFQRAIAVEPTSAGFVQKVVETIKYLGTQVIPEGQFILAPWSLCQFDSGPGSEIRFPWPANGDLWDLYASSEKQRRREGSFCVVDPSTPERFQLGLGASVPWIEYRFQNRFKVKRSVRDLADEPNLIDIADADPKELPSEVGTNLSCYCDPSGFMEIEGCGSSLRKLTPGSSISACISTEYTIL